MTRPAGSSARNDPRTRSSPRPRTFARRRWTSIAAAGVALVGSILAWAILARHFERQSNTSRSRFDAIVVLGTSADSDGNPTPAMLERVTEAVREYRRGVAAHLIVTGAAAHNRYVEAEVMARVAQAQGIPSSAIVLEPRALDTIQNACFSARILKAHGWRSAEVVSSSAHLPRAAMIFSHLASTNPVADHLEWRMHAAPAVLSPAYLGNAAAVVETLKTARYLVWSRWIEGCDE